jgi:UDP-N-acetylmuramoyl-tripeptide--D-alanyl-D-alanine ligase
MDIENIYKLFLAHPTITTDSRNCIDNSLFFALKGSSFNGNRFAAQAIENGCSFAFVDEKEFADGENIIYVSNVLETLQSLARYHRKEIGLPVIAITGTNGKTTTKELIATVLQQKYKTRYTQGNLNNHIGVPLTLLKITKDDELAVIEMGANHLGEIKELCEIALPDFGLITNIGKGHLEGFGSFNGVIQTKAELYDFLRKNQGEIFINGDNNLLLSLAEGMERISYGTNKNSDIQGEIATSGAFLSLMWNGNLINTNLVGNYNFENVLAAITIGKYFDVPDSSIINALTEYVPQNNRSQYKETDKNKLIIDAYNANPTSMKASLTNFLQMPEPNKVVILGDMKELGNESKDEHNSIIKILNDSTLKNVYLVGPCFEQTNAPFNTFNNVDNLLDWLKSNPINDSLVLIKGSNSMNLIKVVDYL